MLRPVITLKHTPLISQHRALGARIVDFAGFAMPLQYSGIIDEHHAVRCAAGLFDVSHMGQITFAGPHAIRALDRLVTNDVGTLSPGQALYTPICNERGGIVDDCVIYLLRDDLALVIVNASNSEKDFAWFDQHARSECTVSNESDRYALLALQGPRAVEILEPLAQESIASLGRFRFKETRVAGMRCTVQRTGYTGEDGFELLTPVEGVEAIWNALLAQGTPIGLKPCGLGARDTLRLEARLLLYGNDIDDTTSPFEAGLGWTVKLDKASDFIGKDALNEQRAQGINRRLCSLVMRTRGIARHGYPIYAAADPSVDTACSTGTECSTGIGQLKPIGQVTSGTMSPTLKQAIALGYITEPFTRVGTQVTVDARGRHVEAEVLRGPFYRRTIGAPQFPADNQRIPEERLHADPI